MRSFAVFVLTFLLLTFSTAAFAIDEIFSPYVDVGEADVEYSNSRTFDREKDKNNLQDSEALIEYSPTNYYHLEIGGFFSKTPDQSFQIDGVEIQNFFQFSEKGSHWVDTGIMIAGRESARDNVVSTVQTKLLLEKDVGKFVNVANIGLEQEVGADASGGPDLTLQWNTQYTLREELAPGFEIQSDLGKSNEGFSFNKGQQYIGPGLYGTVMDHYHYEAAYLAGVSSGASNGAIRFVLQYQTHL